MSTLVLDQPTPVCSGSSPHDAIPPAASPPIVQPVFGSRLAKPGGRVTVVLVEDDLRVRTQLRALLEEEGFLVVGEAVDGVDGVAVVEANQPDVALLDLRMPRMNGIEATRQIRRAAPATRIVLLSAYEDNTLRHDALQAGAFRYLVKGCPARDILGALVDAAAPRVEATASPDAGAVAPPADPTG